MYEKEINYLLDKVRNFKSTKERPFPSSAISHNDCYSGAAYDMAAILAGRKPAAILPVYTHESQITGLDRALLKKLIKEKGCHFKRLNAEHPSNNWLVVGHKPNVQELETIFNYLRPTFFRAGGANLESPHKSTFKLDENLTPEELKRISNNYHRRLGTALGYHPEVIEHFLKEDE